MSQVGGHDSDDVFYVGLTLDPTSYLSSLLWEAQCGPPRRPESARAPAEAQVELKVRTADSNHSSFAPAFCQAVERVMLLRASVVPCYNAAMSVAGLERQHR